MTESLKRPLDDDNEAAPAKRRRVNKKSPLPDPSPPPAGVSCADLPPEMWFEIARQDKDYVARLLSLVCHVTRAAVKGLILDDKFPWWECIGGHRSLKGSLSLDPRLKTKIRVFVDKSVVDRRKRAVLTQRGICELANGAAYYSHMDNLLHCMRLVPGVVTPELVESAILSGDPAIINVVLPEAERCLKEDQVRKGLAYAAYNAIHK